MNDWLLEWIAVYGPLALFVILAVAQVGVPMPTTILLIIVGSLAGMGEMGVWQVLVAATAGAAAGDAVGYLIGRSGGKKLLERFSGRDGTTEGRAERFTARWGDMSIFLSRWLVTPFGPWLNLVSGATGYSARRFMFWVVLGEFVWVVVCVGLGMLFSSSVRYITDIMGSLIWVVFGLAVAVILARYLINYLRQIPSES